MLSYCTNYLATMPDITVYMNCDTRLAINLRMFDLGENDEFIFAIKNFNYIDSPYVFLFRARKSDIDKNGEVIFKIPPTNSKHLKPGAFYNFAILIDAFDPKRDTEYRKLTDNGAVIIEYGAQDLMIEPEISSSKCEVIGTRLELLDELSSIDPSKFMCEVIGTRLELLDEVASIDPNKLRCEVLGVRLELLDEISSIDPNSLKCKVLGVRLELLDEISSIKPDSIMGDIIDMRLEPLIMR